MVSKISHWLPLNHCFNVSIFQGPSPLFMIILRRSCFRSRIRSTLQWAMAIVLNLPSAWPGPVETARCSSYCLLVISCVFRFFLGMKWVSTCFKSLNSHRLMDDFETAAHNLSISQYFSNTTAFLVTHFCFFFKLDPPFSPWPRWSGRLHVLEEMDRHVSL